tara:strand:+ start:5210 stop:5329 length:120 start_codon:yes stop_codon:yes gene_type:complete
MTEERWNYYQKEIQRLKALDKQTTLRVETQFYNLKHKEQ